GKSPLVLGIDLGSSGIRAGVYDRRGQLLDGRVTRGACGLRTTADGGVVGDPVEIVEALEAVVSAALEGAGGRACEIVGVGFSMLASNLVGVDRHGEAITPVYTYADTRPAGAAEALRRALDGGAGHRRTGATLHASYWLAQLAWLRESQPGLWDRVARWMSIGEYFYLRLFGESRCSFSVASWTGLLDWRELAWDRELLVAAGVPLEALSPLADFDRQASGLVPSAAARWPVLARVPWFYPVADGVCNNVGTGCISPARVALTLGTTGAMRVMLPADPALAPPPGLWLYRVDRWRLLLGGALNEGGNLYEWLRRTLQLHEDSDELEAVLAALPPDGHGLTFLPFLTGERSPGWNDRARAAITGLGLDTTAAEIARAGLEAVAYRFALIFERLWPVLPVDASIVASGGAASRSALWMQMLADVLNRPVSQSLETEVSSRGAALLALEALSLLEEVEPPRLGRSFEPDRERHAVYQAALARQQALYGRLFGEPAPG
ncbi:MAG TPA: gluconokinase, partial [Ardenticatenaceae bacterium]|nr:gluconokinase [Ardenticatenaceae bacterium]